MCPKILKEFWDLNWRTNQKKAILKAKSSLEKNCKHQNDWLTHKERKPNTIIKPKVCRKLIRKNVVGNGMKVSEAMKTFKVLRHQVQRIKNEDPNAVKVNKKQPGKFTNEMKTTVLFQLEQQSTTTLHELQEFLKHQFNVGVSTQAISNLIHDMDISWKQLTNIPASWNKPQLIEQRAHFVQQHGLDLEKTIFFVDKAGFDLRSGRGLGYAPSG